jgi:hypothetical protein
LVPRPSRRRPGARDIIGSKPSLFPCSYTQSTNTTIFYWGLALLCSMFTSTPHPDSTYSSHLISSPHQTMKLGQPFPKSCCPPHINLFALQPSEDAFHSASSEASTQKPRMRNWPTNTSHNPVVGPLGGAHVGSDACCMSR